MFNLLKKKNKKEKFGSGVDTAQSGGKDYKKEIENNINVYVMPERFRIVHKQKSKAKVMGMFVVIMGIIFLVAISVLLYFYLIKQKPPATEPAPPADNAKSIKDNSQIKKTEKKNKQKPVIVPEVIETPKKSYVKAKAEFDKVSNFNDFERLILKYGSKNRIKEFKKEKKQVENMPESFKNNIVSLVIRQSMPKLGDIGDIQESIKGNTATLSAATKDLSKNGIIIMEREDNVWKLSSEGWEGTKKETETVEPSLKETMKLNNGLDSDKDGLTDKEEIALGSDLTNSDSDGDGYSDLSEIMNLYNPIGEGLLTNNPAVKEYKNNTYGYDLLYLSGWTINRIEGDDSVIFKSSDNYFIQVITQKNSDSQSIDEWYEQQFHTPNINDSKRVFGDNWRGIRNDDGLTVYLTDNKYNYIYTITYNIGDRNISEYNNIFEMMVKSFKIGN